MTMLDYMIPLIVALLVFGILAGIVPIMVWVERRGAGFIQNRLGPNVVGPFGIFQPIADAIKLFFKEDATPDRVDTLFFFSAPILVVVFATLAAAALPFGETFYVGGEAFELQVSNIPVGLLYLLAVGSFSVYGIMLAGCSSGNKYALFGALRATAQMISYEVGLGIGIATMVMVFGSFDIREMVMLQSTGLLDWGFFRAPLVFFLIMVAVFAETNRLPFDLAEGEAEIVGFHVEYSSMRFALFFMAEYMHMVVGSALLVCLFFGGWHVPGLSHAFMLEGFQSLGWSLQGASIATVLIQLSVMLIKIAVILWIFVWVRWSYPRFRYDQLMRFGWKGVIPYALVSLALTTVWTYLRSQS